MYCAGYDAADRQREDEVGHLLELKIVEESHSPVLPLKIAIR